MKSDDSSKKGSNHSKDKKDSISVKSPKDNVKDMIEGMVGEESGKIEGISHKDIKIKVKPSIPTRYQFKNTHEMTDMLNKLKIENRKLHMYLELVDNSWHKDFYRLRTLTNILQDVAAKIDSTCEKIDAKFITLIDTKDTLRQDFYSAVKNSIVFNNLHKHMIELKEEINVATSEKSVREALKTTGDTFKVMEMLRK